MSFFGEPMKELMGSTQQIFPVHPSGLTGELFRDAHPTAATDTIAKIVNDMSSASGGPSPVTAHSSAKTFTHDKPVTII